MAYYPPGSSHWQQDQQPTRQRRSARLARAPRPPKALRKHGKLRLAIIVAAVVAVICVIGAFSPSKLPDFQQGQRTPYVKLEQQGMAYRVAIDPKASDAQLRAVFNKLTQGDGYKLHTVFFFSSLQIMDEGWGYDVALLSDDSGHFYMDRK